MDKDLKSYLDKEFASLHQEMTEISGAIVDHMEKRFEQVDARFEQIDVRFDELTPTLSKVGNHENRIKYLEDKLPKLA